MKSDPIVTKDDASYTRKDEASYTRSVASNISVVIPVRNEAAGLAACIEGILRQSVPVLEIIVIDSGSTDGTQKIAGSYELVRLIEIPPGDFNHGETRNLGWREAKGEFVLFTVGDARPVDETWIARLLEGLTDDDVVAASGLQVVPHEASTNPIAWFRPASQPKVSVIRFDNSTMFEHASPDVKVASCGLDDVTAIYRRSALQGIGFRKVTYGEDVLFAYDAYRAGKAIAFCPAARVFHYHMESYDSVLKRTVAVASLRHRLFHCPSPRPGYFLPLARYAWRLARETKLSWHDRIRWLRYNERILAGINRGIDLVNDAVKVGGSAIEKLHARYCGTPPIPLKRPH